jgi:hypothetical protein
MTSERQEHIVLKVQEIVESLLNRSNDDSCQYEKVNEIFSMLVPPERSR